MRGCVDLIDEINARENKVVVIIMDGKSVRRLQMK